MRKPYFITYDLNSPGQKYKNIISTIENDIAGSWCKYWESSYLITSSLTPNQMLEKLDEHLDSGDKFIAIEVTNNYQGWLTEKQWKFIRENLFT